ncbi:SEL1-like repeat protein [Lawsonibacter sp. LCP25S3_G6]|uniref:SEL1-like repeat protein n=1 Tax=unclassified Lawsonibacter TaxID=2617946 RepID=UPI003F964263
MEENLMSRFEEWMESDQNDPEVQYQIGLCYQRGEGVEQNGTEAEKWLRRAAGQGHPAAMALFAAPDVQTDLQAITEDNLPDWCLRAEEGDPEGQYQVACYILEHPGWGSRPEAIHYLTLAAKWAGDGRACLKLAQLRLEEGNHNKAVPMLRNAADCGESKALELLAECYARGLGLEQDPQEAERLLIQWAEQGDGETKLALARRYKLGKDVPKNMGKALSWLKRAQLAGMEDADRKFYAEERVQELVSGLLGHNQDAFSADLVHAEQGDAEAQNRIGVYYYTGRNVEQDYVKAVEWFQKAADQGSAHAQKNLGNCYRNGLGVGQDDALAAACYQKAAEQGMMEAQALLGDCYYDGQGVNRDYALAAFWYQKAAEQGHAGSQVMLGGLYYYGLGVETDDDKAFALFQKAAEQGEVRAHYSLGLCYQSGRGVMQDDLQAAVHYRKAAEGNNPPGQYSLGLCYGNGWGVEHDNEQAVFWIRKAAEQGLTNAQCVLGNCYRDGTGVEQDRESALFWYRKAASQGNERAREHLAELGER